MSAESASAPYLKDSSKRHAVKESFVFLDFFRSWHFSKPNDRGKSGSPGFHIAADVTASRHSDGLVLIHQGKGVVFSANRVGALIWNGAVQRWSLDRVAESISSEFQIP